MILEVHALDLRQINLLDVYQAQKFAHWLRHLAPTLIARTTALRYTDLGPELFLIQPEAPPDFARIQYTLKEFHGFIV